jgi:5'-nucleotidase (lipoprotein e(P4) family)
MYMRKLLILALLLTGCATGGTAPPCNAGLALVNASLWVQSAAEFKAASRQTYNIATRMLESALSQSPEPAAVILDLDETAIENAEFEARMVRQGITYDQQQWLKWVNESDARAMPGAAEFLAFARSRGVTPFYITNRKSEEEAGTRRNLERLGYPLMTGEDNLLTRGERPEWESSDKGPRRNWVASRYRVLLVLGDDLNDFADAHDKNEAERNAIVAENAAKWGTSWLIVPNPMYGSWERAAAGTTGTECEKLQRKIEALRP